MDSIIYLVCAAGGVLALLLSVVFLFKQKTVVDQSGHVTEIEVPFFGKIKSNYPSVLIAFIGAALAAFTVNRIQPIPEMTDFLAEVGMAEGAETNELPAFVGVVPQSWFRALQLDSSGQGTVSFGVNAGQDYQVVVLKPVWVDETRTRYQSVYGSALYNTEKDSLFFEGKLR